MKDFFTLTLLVLLLVQASCLALNRQHDAACTTCPAGYSKSGDNCLQTCPAGWTDQGASCRLQDYGRGGGYPYRFGDPLGDSGPLRRCEADNGPGNCEKLRNSFYPKCKAGFKPFHCCVCLAAPDCNAFGFNGGSGSSCTKKVITC